DLPLKGGGERLPSPLEGEGGEALRAGWGGEATRINALPGHRCTSAGVAALPPTRRRSAADLPLKGGGENPPNSSYPSTRFRVTVALPVPVWSMLRVGASSAFAPRKLPFAERTTTLSAFAPRKLP